MPDNLSNKDKLFNLFLEELEAIKEKKAAVAAFNDNIKRIKAEQKDLLDAEDLETERAQEAPAE